MRSIGRGADLGALLLRIGVGAVFAVHGWEKYDGGVGTWADVLRSLDVPAPEVVAWLQIVAEGVGGLMLIVGVLTRLITLPLIGIMIGAILLVKVDVGFIVADATGAELETALLAGLLGLLFIGPGRFSVDGVFGMRGSARRARAEAPLSE